MNLAVQGSLEHYKISQLKYKTQYIFIYDNCISFPFIFTNLFFKDKSTMRGAIESMQNARWSIRNSLFDYPTLI